MASDKVTRPTIHKQPDTKVDKMPGAPDNEVPDTLEDLPSEWRDEDAMIDGRKPRLDEIEDDQSSI